NDLKQLYKDVPAPRTPVLQPAVDQDTKPVEPLLRTTQITNSRAAEQPARMSERSKAALKRYAPLFYTRRSVTIGAISFAVLLCAAAGFWISRSAAGQVAMPDLHGQTADQANVKLQKLGWHGHVVVSKVPSSAAQDGSIVEETPDAGSKIKLSQTIYLKVANQASDPNKTADFTGQDASLIYAKLIQAGVPAANITLKAQPSANSAGMVLSQNPAADSQFDPQTAPVELDVAVPAGEALVPGVLNLNVDAAGQLLIQNGLHYHYTIDRSGGTPNTVADQDIPPGRVVPNGSTVELHVANSG
ncbi:MAG: serine/threonine protein kinase, partial [Bacilli bacterium]|nr:serine/threonine protein kinase [Bacilli bacterium]